MKLLLIQPPVEDFYDTEVRLQPIGLAYQKAAVNQHLPEIEVKIIDFHHGWGRRTVSIPSDLSYLKNYYSRNDHSPFRLFHNYYRFGASAESIQEFLTVESPDVVGISSLFTAYYREALQVAHYVKSATSAIVVMGGSHISAVPELMLSDPSVDFVIQGEGEIPIVELLTLFSSKCEPGIEDLKGIAGLGFKEDSRLIIIPQGPHPEVSTLPVPELSDLSLSDYRFRGKPLTFMITSRSCPHRCSFCSVHTTFGTTYRRRTVDNILSEIRLRYEQGYRVIDFEDDNLTLHLPEIKELCRKLSKEPFQKSIEFVAMNGISYLSLDRELLQLMRDAGFGELNLSLVSYDSTVLKTSKRPHTVHRFREVVSAAHQLGFKLTAYQILGLPYESLDSMIQTLCFLTEQPVLMGGSPFYLIPESPIAREMDLKIDPEMMVRARLTALAMDTNQFSRDDIYTLFITIRILNFLKRLPVPNGTEIRFAELLEGWEKYVQKRQTRLMEMAQQSLRSLFEKRVLLGFEQADIYPVTRFKPDLWFEVWNRLSRIATLDDGSILPGKI